VSTFQTEIGGEEFLVVTMKEGPRGGEIDGKNQRQVKRTHETGGYGATNLGKTGRQAERGRQSLRVGKRVDSHSEALREKQKGKVKRVFILRARARPVLRNKSSNAQKLAE